MKCPLLSAAVITSNRVTEPDWANCLKEECAWWDKGMGQCSVASTAYFLRERALKLSELIDRMP